MATVAHFQITDYDNQLHEFYRFLDGYPCDSMGVFATFPRGDHDFCLETFVRRLELSKSSKSYWADVSYKMDLKTRMIEVSSGCYEGFNFKGSFEEAIRHYVDKDYSEKDALSKFPAPSDLSFLNGENLIDWFWEIIRAIKYGIPELDYHLFEERRVIIGDNPIFYKFNDFVVYPSCEMNRNYKAIIDAELNARRIGLMTYFENKISNTSFMLNYMMLLSKEGYLLPMTHEFIPYGYKISEDIKQTELEMIVEYIKSQDFKIMRGRNILYGLQSDAERQEIKENIRKRNEESKKI